jgi:hypothetical protein
LTCANKEEEQLLVSDRPEEVVTDRAVEENILGRAFISGRVNISWIEFPLLY